MKKVYYIHPATTQGIVYVTRERKFRPNRRQKVLNVEYMVDTPGTWDKEKWNLHVDGCDYLHNTLEDAIKQGADFYDYDPLKPNRKPGYELRRVDVAFDWNKTNPDYYHIKEARPFAN